MAEQEFVVVEEQFVSDDSDDDFDYEAAISDDNISSDDDDEDLETALKTINKAKSPKKAKKEPAGEVDMELRSKTSVKPSVIDDFIRNFLIKMGMFKTLDCFNTEWYRMQMKKQINTKDLDEVPDIYLQNQQLGLQIKEMQDEVSKMRQLAEKAQGTWNKFRKERDFHRMHHKRVVQEKQKLVKDIKRLKKHFAGYEPALKTMRHKYEAAMKDKMLLRLERDRLLGKNKTMEETIRNMTEAGGMGTTKSETKSKKKKKKNSKGDSLIPDEPGPNPYEKLEFDASEVEGFTMQKTFKGHLNPVSAMAFHPKKPILATVSDDETWKMWSAPNGELIMSGEGHKDWLSGVAFHPTGSQLATCAGDGDVKLWDFVNASCAHTFSDHTQAVWGVAYHHAGDFIVSCSMDHTSKLWDLHSLRCRQTFRGHVDSVNAVAFQPFTNNICTASGDKTVSLWDIRTGLCVQTFYGHMNSCNDVAFTLNGRTIASCDADGICKLWDVRSVTQLGEVDAGPHPVNKLDFDRSGTILAAASDDGSVKLFNAQKQTHLKDLQGHEDAVQSVLFDPMGKFVVSGSSDCTFRFWS